MSTSKPPEPQAAAETQGAAGAAPSGDSSESGSVGAAAAGWDEDATSTEVAAAAASEADAENPMWEEKTVLAAAAPPPASVVPVAEAFIDAPVSAAAMESVPAPELPRRPSRPSHPRPLAATMAGPGALATAMASAEAIQVSVGNPAAQPGQAAAPSLRPVDPTDGYLNSIIADRYKVLAKIGEGGMGTVYLAEHIIIEKKVALKVLSEDFARKADLVQRFMQEAKAASRIGHENIVDITDFGETPSGSVFIAMEYLEGQDLANVIRNAGALGFERTRNIITQICRALGAAHAKGIIHRDMKPENVFLIEREGRTDFVKILDFGIAKVSSLDEGGSRLTRTGMIFGTPEYMSPEQARGDRPDHRVDIYAVGCILYEMLTGDVPFHADTFMGVLTKHMFEQPTPPSQRAPDKNIAPEVEAVALKAISKDRDQRFQTMKEMSMALAACGGDGEGGWGNEPSGVFDMPAPSGKAVSTTSVKSVQAVAAAQSAADDDSLSDRPKSNRWKFVLGGVGLGTIGIAAFIGLSHRADVQPVVPVKPVQQITPPPVAPVAPPVAPVTPVAATTATVSINSTPAGADVFSGSKMLGTTPLSLALPIDAKGVPLQLRKRDFRDREIEVTPDKDRSYEFDLLPAPKKSIARPNVKPTLPPTPTPAQQKTGTAKPAGRLRDLKDPFSDEPSKPKH